MTQVITRACAHYRAPGLVEEARAAAREALAPLTERERAMFALAVLEGVNSPANAGLLEFIAGEVRKIEGRLTAALMAQ